MEKLLQHSLYEQLLYSALLRITNNKKLTIVQKEEKARKLGEVFGKKSFLLFSKQLPPNAYKSTDEILNLIATEYWKVLFRNETSSVTYPIPQSISFKDNNLEFLKRLDCSVDMKDKKDEFVTCFQYFVSGIIAIVLTQFRIDFQTNVTIQNDCIFINIECEKDLSNRK